MQSGKDSTASFLLRLNQKIYHTEEQGPKVEWRGNIRHVQSGDETKFSDFKDAQDFVQEKLTELTKTALEDQPEEVHDGILSQSLNLWKKIATNTPRIVMESIKDPKRGAEQLQDQFQQQLNQLSDAIGQRIDGSKKEMENLIPPSKAEISEALNRLLEKLESIEQRLEKIEKKK
jgi:hypothetical protein